MTIFSVLRFVLVSGVRFSNVHCRSDLSCRTFLLISNRKRPSPSCLGWKCRNDNRTLPEISPWSNRARHSKFTVSILPLLALQDQILIVENYIGNHLKADVNFRESSDFANMFYDKPWQVKKAFT